MTKRLDQRERPILRPLSFRLRHSRLFTLVFSLVAFPGVAATFTNSILPLAPPPPLPDAGFSVLRVFGALTIVIALFLAGVWVFRNWRLLSGQRNRPQYLQLLESRSLGGRHALHVVGYQNQRLLLASSPNGVALVSHLPAEEARPDSGTPGAAPAATSSLLAPTDAGNFVQALQQAIQRKP